MLRAAASRAIPVARRTVLAKPQGLMSGISRPIQSRSPPSNTGWSGARRIFPLFVW